jgi:DNA polymerase-3 subunit beta
MGDRLGIGDFARRTGLSISALRFYDDRGVLPPAAVDPSSGYRSYDAAQVATAVLLRDLRRLGLGLAEVAAFLDAPPSARAGMVAAHVDGLARRLDDARSIASAITTRTEIDMTTMTLPAADLGRALDQVLPAASTDPELPVLTCVLVEAKDGSLRLAATDTFRLAVRDLAPSGSDAGAAFRSLQPATTLRRWRAALPSSGDVTVAVADDHLVVRGDGIDLTQRSVVATFPAYEAILDRDGDAVQVVIDRAALLSALESFVDDDGAVLLRVGDGRVTVERRDVSMTLDARATADAAVAIDPTYAADAVRAAIGPEVVLDITSAVHPVVFRSADDGTFTTLVMPVRLD